MSDPYYRSTSENSTMAIVSLVAGILGLSFLPGLASIVAIITAGMADKEIRESGGRLEGENLARIGRILGWIGVGLMVLTVCCVVAGLLLFFPAVMTQGSFSSVLFALAV